MKSIPDSASLFEREEVASHEMTRSFSASLAENNTDFLDDSSVADDLDSEYFDTNTVDFEWFDEVPENAHENHRDHSN